jgi:hypothetical protein
MSTEVLVPQHQISRRYQMAVYCAVLVGLGVLTACGRDQATGPQSSEVPSLKVRPNQVDYTGEDDSGGQLKLTGVTNATISFDQGSQHWYGNAVSSTYKVGNLAYYASAWATVTANNLQNRQGRNGASQCTATASVQVPNCGTGRYPVEAAGTHTIEHLVYGTAVGPALTSDRTSC